MAKQNRNSVKPASTAPAVTDTTDETAIPTTETAATEEVAEDDVDGAADSEDLGDDAGVDIAEDDIVEDDDVLDDEAGETTGEDAPAEDTTETQAELTETAATTEETAAIETSEAPVVTVSIPEGFDVEGFKESSIVASYWTNQLRTYAGYRKIKEIVSDATNADSVITSIEVPTQEIVDLIIAIIGEQEHVVVTSTEK